MFQSVSTGWLNPFAVVDEGGSEIFFLGQVSDSAQRRLPRPLHRAEILSGGLVPMVLVNSVACCSSDEVFASDLTEDDELSSRCSPV